MLGHSIASPDAAVYREAGDRSRVPDALDKVVGSSPGMLEVKNTLRSLAAYSINLLLTGPTGTGKSFLSRLYHAMGPRAARPFVEVPCPNIPATLFESELFGHARGAFTDARSERRGLIVEASGGTVFLDEITEISPRVQAKLLYVSESRQVRPVGSSSPVDVNVQFVSATNRNLSRLVAQGRFRRDLYYRLSGIELSLPPLRDRGEDILLLAEAFMREFTEVYGKDVRGWDAATESWFLAYAWPGNVRELRETLRIGFLRARSCWIERGDLKVWAVHEDDGPPDLRADTVLRHHLKRVLAIARGNLTRAGALLGWERNKVRREARRLGVPVPRGNPAADDDPEERERREVPEELEVLEVLEEPEEPFDVAAEDAHATDGGSGHGGRGVADGEPAAVATADGVGGRRDPGGDREGAPPGAFG